MLDPEGDPRQKSDLTYKFSWCVVDQSAVGCPPYISNWSPSSNVLAHRSGMES
jgi:hypothetical protein